MFYHSQRYDGIEHLSLQRLQLNESVPWKGTASRDNRNWVGINTDIVGSIDIRRKRATSAANVQHAPLQERPNG